MYSDFNRICLGKLRLPTDSYGFLWIPKDSYGFLGIHGFLRTLTDSWICEQVNAASSVNYGRSSSLLRSLDGRPCHERWRRLGVLWTDPADWDTPSELLRGGSTTPAVPAATVSTAGPCPVDSPGHAAWQPKVLQNYF